MFLSQKGIKHTLVEKFSFPRDKICGDGLSGKVLSVLKAIEPNAHLEMEHDPSLFMPSKGIVFVSPDYTKLRIPFKNSYLPDEPAPGYVSKRLDFDHYLYKKTESEFCKRLENTELTKITKVANGLCLEFTSQGEIEIVETPLLIAADGSRSLAARQLAGIELEPEHYSAGIRTYYSGVKNLDKEGYIELLFLKKYKPGYLWIFPLPDGKANVGAGMLTSAISRQKIDLKKMMLDTLANDPEIAPRFAQAQPESKIQGWGLPLGSKKRKISGAHFMLLGDAAALIDPFTGEGIAQAMQSGRIAALVAEEALQSGEFTHTLKQYDELVYKKVWNEARLSYLMQKLSKRTWLFNLVVGKASRNPEIQNLITSMFSNINLRKQFLNPMFYLRLLFKS